MISTEKKIKIIILIILNIFSINACAKPQTPEIKKDFPKKVTLTESKKIFQDVIILPSSMTIIDNYLLTLSDKTDTLIHIFSLPDLKIIKSIGVKGGGPDDFNLAKFCINESSYLYIFDYFNINSRVIKKIDFQSTNKYKTIKKYGISGFDDFSTFFTPHILNDTLLYYVNVSKGKCSINSFNLNSQKIVLSSKYEIKKEETNFNPFYYINKGAINMNKQTVAYFYLYKDQIDFYDTNLKPKKIVIGEAPSKINNPDDALENKVYYMSTFAGTNKLYFKNCKGKSLETAKQNPQYIEVFDNEGNPLIEYKIEKPFIHFVVDEKNNKIYVTSKDEDYFIVYDL